MDSARLLVFLLAFLGGVNAYSQANYAQNSSTTSSATSDQQARADNRVAAQIRILGLSRVPESKVRSVIHAKEFSPYTNDQQSLDIAALLATGEFTSVKMNRVELGPKAYRLDIEVAEATAPIAISTETAWPEISISTITTTPAPVAASTSAAAPQPTTWPPRPARSQNPASMEPPWVIGDIAATGNHHVKFNVIRSQVKARKGDIYEKADLEHDIQSLLGLGDFERVAADISPMGDKPVPAHLQDVAASTFCVKLTWVVEEKPLIRKIKFDGYKKISKGKLFDTITLKEKDPLDRVKVNTDVHKVQDLYTEKGYLDAKITPEINVDTGAAEADVIFHLAEGPRTLIGSVSVEGVHAFKPKKIVKQMETNRRKKVYNENKMQDDIKLIEAYYKNNGYLDCKVSSYTVAYSTEPDKKKVYITIPVEEGHQYRFGTTTFSGYRIFSSSELAQAVDYRRGKFFSQEKFDTTIRNVQEMYADTGRLRTRVSHQKVYNEETKQMDVVFDIQEGGISYIDHIDVEGNHATKTYVIAREITIHPGEPFSAKKIKKSQEKIRNLGFIDDINLDVQSPVEPEKVDLTFDVLEGKPGMLTAGAGFSSLDGLIGTLSMQHMNLFGRAQRASISWQFGARVQDYSLSWTTPWLNNSPTSLGVDLFNTRRIHPFDTTLNGYIDRRLGAAVRLGPRFQDDKYLLNFTYTIQKVTIGNVDPGFLNILPESTSVQSSLGAEFARDTRDNIWDPTHGSRNSIGAVLSGGPVFLGDVNFLKPYIANAIHFHMTDINEYPLVLSFSNRASYVTPFSGSKEVPVFERFFLGGQDTLRGYAPNGEVGPPDGGKTYDVFNVELGFPLAREHKTTIVKIVEFLDAGTAWDNMRSVNWRFGTGEQNLKTDIGIGIRFTTPAFPIRLDYGYGLNHRPGERLYQINFGIGSLF